MSQLFRALRNYRNLRAAILKSKGNTQTIIVALNIENIILISKSLKTIIGLTQLVSLLLS